jgi:hypothetical protein
MRMNSTGEIILVHTLVTINSEWNCDHNTNIKKDVL